MEFTPLVVLSVVAGLYMAWNIGANDVANAFGASVGSRALTLRRAIVLAAIFEFAGAFLVGAPVAKTISGSIIQPGTFEGDPQVLGVGMLSALLAAAVWVNIATFFGQPVSTTHSIIGAVIGFAVVSKGPFSVSWPEMVKIAASWVVSPLVGGTLAYVIYRFGVRRYILNSRHPVFMAIATMPLAIAGLVSVVTFSVVYKGLPRLHLDLGLPWALVLALSMFVVISVTLRLALHRKMWRHKVPRARRMQAIEKWFGYMQIGTASYMAFAHGANDVANAIGPLAAAVEILRTNMIPPSIEIPPWLLAMGAAGIVLGLATYGYKVIEAIGKKITEITPTRGFSADFGTATTVLVFSKLGMPISTTFVIVGAVMGVGLARGFAAIDLGVVRRIFASWLVTIPISAILSAIIFWIIMSMQ